MHGLYLASVFFHLLAAIAWIGAMFFLVVVIVPLLRRGDRAAGAALLSASGPRLRAMGWVAFGVLLLTGTFNLWVRGVRWSSLVDPAWLRSAMGHLVVLKLALFGFVLVMSAYHDFHIGPRAADAVAKDATSPEAERLRRIASVIGRGNAVIALLIVAVAVMIVRGAP